MKRLLLLSIALLIGMTAMAKEETTEEKKSLTDEERTTLIHKTLREREVELVIDPWGGAGAECKELEKTSKGWVASSKKREVFFERGYTFKPIGFAHGYRYVFEAEGKYYGANISEVLLADSDDEETLEFMTKGKSRQLTTLVGRFYGTSSALWMMLLVMGAAALVAVLYLLCGMASLRTLFLAIIPAAILIFSLIEIFGYWKFGSDIFWWCEYERYGFFGSLFRLFPFAAMVAAQVYSIKLYERALFLGNDDPNDDECKISLKPAAWSLALCIPVLVILAFSLAGLGLQQTIWMDVVPLIAFLGTLGTGLYISFHRNVKTFGRLTGLWVTIFSIVYIIGCIISAIAMIVLVFQIIFQILCVLGTILILLMVGSRRRVYRNGRVYEEVY